MVGDVRFMCTERLGGRGALGIIGTIAGWGIVEREQWLLG